MKYLSTRGTEKGLSFEEVLFSGYARDNGLYMPESIPHLGKEDLTLWRNCSYNQIMVKVLRKFIDKEEINDFELNEIVDRSLKRFSMPGVIPMAIVESRLKIFELYHGPTLAFKDISMSILSNLMRYFLRKRQTHTVALVGTAGDTGASSISCMANQEEMDLIVLYPKDLISLIQKRQMTGRSFRNVHVYEVEGTSDDLDVPIKQCFSDPDFVKKHNLTCVNSVNWVRVCAQIPHFIYAYFKATTNNEEILQISIPTGAGGNIAAGCIAHRMGLPIELIAAVNSNDIVARSLTCGDFSLKEEVVASFASAMNIQMPYNIERLLYVLSEYDTLKVKNIMTDFEENGRTKIDSSLCKAMQDIVVDTHIADNEEILSVMKRIHQNCGYFVCPQTAVAVSYHLKHANVQPCSSSKLRAALATASFSKFPEAARLAGLPLPSDLLNPTTGDTNTKVNIMNKENDWLHILRSKIESITASGK